MLLSILLNSKPEETAVKTLTDCAIGVIRVVTSNADTKMYSVSVMAHLLSSTNFTLPAALLEEVLAATLGLPLQLKLELAKFLQASNQQLYEDLVVRDFLHTEDLSFMAQHMELVESRPELFLPHLPNIKNKDLIKIFVLPQYKQYILGHLNEFAATP